MSKNARDNRPYIKPVTRIELSDENFTLRWILIVLLVAIAVTALFIGITSMMETESGWKAIEVSSDSVNCSLDFKLFYDLGAQEQSATVENKLLSTLYSKATEDAHMIFSAYDQKDGVNNVHYLNQHLNETVTVDETLYQALELINRYNNRNIFMAPVNVEYNRIFFSTSDVEAAGFDPAQNSNVMEFVEELVSYAGNPEMINLEILGDNQVRLNVSEEYLSFAETEEIEVFVDFSWMTNAFIIDYIADVLVESGYTNGYLVSYDGFTRNLDTRGDVFHQNVFDYTNGEVFVPAAMSYDQPISMVYLRSYPMADEDKWHYYRFEDGNVISIMLDPADGISKASTSDLISYSYQNVGCAEILMEMIPVFIADDFSVEKLDGLKTQEIYSVWSEEKTLYHNDSDLTLELAEGESVYSIALAQ